MRVMNGWVGEIFLSLFFFFFYKVVAQMGWTPRTIMSNEDRNHVFLLSLSLSHPFSSSSGCQNRIG